MAQNSAQITGIAFSELKAVPQQLSKESYSIELGRFETLKTEPARIFYEVS